eukprot:TRINITY_DN7812_c0_g1_i1.p1 TRINITY_DN7812_c0_g1~~TRINITY_DN7812_c0_g1_i1.p1  ORF type:complete len:2262 (-),score=319.76 TRINITY_DN7812_c0_g1_i1:183-6968(-)
MASHSANMSFFQKITQDLLERDGKHASRSMVGSRLRLAPKEEPLVQGSFSLGMGQTAFVSEKGEDGIKLECLGNMSQTLTPGAVHASLVYDNQCHHFSDMNLRVMLAFERELCEIEVPWRPANIPHNYRICARRHPYYKSCSAACEITGEYENSKPDVEFSKVLAVPFKNDAGAWLFVEGKGYLKEFTLSTGRQVRAAELDSAMSPWQFSAQLLSDVAMVILQMRSCTGDETDLDISALIGLQKEIEGRDELKSLQPTSNLLKIATHLQWQGLVAKTTSTHSLVDILASGRSADPSYRADIQLAELLTTFLELKEKPEVVDDPQFIKKLRVALEDAENVLANERGKLDPHVRETLMATYEHILKILQDIHRCMECFITPDEHFFCEQSLAPRCCDCCVDCGLRAVLGSASATSQELRGQFVEAVKAIDKGSAEWQFLREAVHEIVSGSYDSASEQSLEKILSIMAIKDGGNHDILEEYQNACQDKRKVAKKSRLLERFTTAYKDKLNSDAQYSLLECEVKLFAMLKGQKIKLARPEVLEQSASKLWEAQLAGTHIIKKDQTHYQRVTIKSSIEDQDEVLTDLLEKVDGMASSINSATLASVHLAPLHFRLCAMLLCQGKLKEAELSLSKAASFADEHAACKGKLQTWTALGNILRFALCAGGAIEIEEEELERLEATVVQCQRKSYPESCPCVSTAADFAIAANGYKKNSDQQSNSDQQKMLGLLAQLGEVVFYCTSLRVPWLNLIRELCHHAVSTSAKSFKIKLGKEPLQLCPFMPCVLHAFADSRKYDTMNCVHAHLRSMPGAAGKSTHGPRFFSCSCSADNIRTLFDQADFYRHLSFGKHVRIRLDWPCSSNDEDDRRNMKLLKTFLTAGNMHCPLEVYTMSKNVLDLLADEQVCCQHRRTYIGSLLHLAVQQFHDGYLCEDNLLRTIEEEGLKFCFVNDSEDNSPLIMLIQHATSVAYADRSWRLVHTLLKKALSSRIKCPAGGKVMSLLLGSPIDPTTVLSSMVESGWSLSPIELLQFAKSCVEQQDWQKWSRLMRVCPDIKIARKYKKEHNAMIAFCEPNLLKAMYGCTKADKPDLKKLWKAMEAEFSWCQTPMCREETAERLSECLNIATCHQQAMAENTHRTEQACKSVRDSRNAIQHILANYGRSNQLCDYVGLIASHPEIIETNPEVAIFAFDPHTARLLAKMRKTELDRNTANALDELEDFPQTFFLQSISKLNELNTALHRGELCEEHLTRTDAIPAKYRVMQRATLPTEVQSIGPHYADSPGGNESMRVANWGDQVLGIRHDDRWILVQGLGYIHKSHLEVKPTTVWDVASQLVFDIVLVLRHYQRRLSAGPSSGLSMERMEPLLALRNNLEARAALPSAVTKLLQIVRLLQFQIVHARTNELADVAPDANLVDVDKAIFQVLGDQTIRVYASTSSNCMMIDNCSETSRPVLFDPSCSRPEAMLMRTFAVLLRLKDKPWLVENLEFRNDFAVALHDAAEAISHRTGEVEEHVQERLKYFDLMVRKLWQVHKVMPGLARNMSSTGLRKASDKVNILVLDDYRTETSLRDMCCTVSRLSKFMNDDRAKRREWIDEEEVVKEMGGNGFRRSMPMNEMRSKFKSLLERKLGWRAYDIYADDNDLDRMLDIVDLSGKAESARNSQSAKDVLTNALSEIPSLQGLQLLAPLRLHLSAMYLQRGHPREANKLLALAYCPSNGNNNLSEAWKKWKSVFALAVEIGLFLESTNQGHREHDLRRAQQDCSTRNMTSNSCACMDTGYHLCRTALSHCMYSRNLDQAPQSFHRAWECIKQLRTVASNCSCFHVHWLGLIRELIQGCDYENIQSCVPNLTVSEEPLEVCPILPHMYCLFEDNCDYDRKLCTRSICRQAAMVVQEMPVFHVCGSLSKAGEFLDTVLEVPGGLSFTVLIFVDETPARCDEVLDQVAHLILRSCQLGTPETRVELYSENTLLLSLAGEEPVSRCRDRVFLGSPLHLQVQQLRNDSITCQEFFEAVQSTMVQFALVYDSEGHSPLANLVRHAIELKTSGTELWTYVQEVMNELCTSKQTRSKSKTKRQRAGENDVLKMAFACPWCSLQCLDSMSQVGWELSIKAKKEFVADCFQQMDLQKWKRLLVLCPDILDRPALLDVLVKHSDRRFIQEAIAARLSDAIRQNPDASLQVFQPRSELNSRDQNEPQMSDSELGAPSSSSSSDPTNQRPCTQLRTVLQSEDSDPGSRGFDTIAGSPPHDSTRQTWGQRMLSGFAGSFWHRQFGR